MRAGGALDLGRFEPEPLCVSRTEPTEEAPDGLKATGDLSEPPRQSPRFD